MLKRFLSISRRTQPDINKEFILITDASNYAIGAVLAQKDDEGKEQMIYAYSKSLNSAQKNYTVSEKELLAIVKSCEYFRHYLLGKKFLLKTDHQALTALQTSENLNSRLMRWSFALQEYDFELSYLKGDLNIADHLSRSLIQPPNPKGINSISTDISDSEKNDILEAYHINLGHGSSNSMKFSVSQKYSWPGIHKDIEDFVSKCVICLKSGGARINTKNNAINTTRPNELWEIDIIGPLHKTSNNYKFIIVGIDHYTKWIETQELKTKDMHSVAEFIQGKIVGKHGIPEKILTDQGCEFDNMFIKGLTSKLNIEFKMASPAHHQTVGAVERANQSLMNKLKKLTNFGNLSWDQHLEAATAAVNMSFNRSISTSPYIMKHGKLPDIEIDNKYGKTKINRCLINIKNARDKNFSTYAQKDIVKGKISASNNFKVNDSVLIFKRKLCDKMANEWKPGYKILEILSPTSFIVTNGRDNYRLNKIHIKLDTSKEGGEGDVVNI